jgi:hypothetical protein
LVDRKRSAIERRIGFSLNEQWLVDCIILYNYELYAFDRLEKGNKEEK